MGEVACKKFRCVKNRFDIPTSGDRFADVMNPFHQEESALRARLLMMKRTYLLDQRITQTCNDRLFYILPCNNLAEAHIFPMCLHKVLFVFNNRQFCNHPGLYMTRCTTNDFVISWLTLSSKECFCRT